MNRGSHRSRSRRAALLAAALLAVAVAPAHARVDITSLTVGPAGPQAASHPDLTIGMAFSPSPSSDDLRSLTITLPPGLVGNPLAAARCPLSTFTSGTCPAGTQLGTSTATAVTDGVLRVTTDLAGTVYNLQPRGSEPARLGVVIKPGNPILAGSTAPVRLEVPIVLRPDLGYRLQNRIDGIPRTATVSGSRQDITLTRMSMTLRGTVGGKPFVIMPSSCAGGPLQADAVSYDQPGTTTSRTATVTPTGCARVPFRPSVTGTIRVPSRITDAVAVDVTIAQPPGDSTMRRAQVVLPEALTPNLAAVSRACPADRAAAGDCPASARIGTARVRTPLLPATLVAPVFLAARSGGGLPRVAVPLLGGVLFGDTGVTPEGIVNTFDGLPDVPLSSFELSIDGGKDGLVMPKHALCRPGTSGAATATLTAHAGRTVVLHPRLAIAGCRPASPKPRGSATMTVRRGTGLLRLALKAGASPISSFSVSLPSTLRSGRGRLVVRGSGKARAFRVLRGWRVARVRFTRATRSASLSWSGLKPRGALLRALKAHRHGRLTLTVRLVDARGHARTLRVPVTARGR